MDFPHSNFEFCTALFYILKSCVLAFSNKCGYTYIHLYVYVTVFSPFLFCFLANPGVPRVVAVPFLAVIKRLLSFSVSVLRNEVSPLFFFLSSLVFLLFVRKYAFVLFFLHFCFVIVRMPGISLALFHVC